MRVVNKGRTEDRLVEMAAQSQAGGGSASAGGAHGQPGRWPTRAGDGQSAFLPSCRCGGEEVLLSWLSTSHGDVRRYQRVWCGVFLRDEHVALKKEKKET